MKKPILEVERLSVWTRGRQCLVHDVDLSLCEEERLGIAGESGSGKTVTAKAILGLLPDELIVSAQRMSLLGHDLLTLPDEERSALIGMHVGFVPQNTVAYLHPLIKIKNQIADGYLHYRAATRRSALEKAKYLLSRVGIKDAARVLESYPGELSGGMRQRVNIAMALMCDPVLIVADEPTTALDSLVQRQVMELFLKINSERNVAVLMISHDLNLIRHYSDRMVVMYAGQVVEEGGSEEMFEMPRHPYTKALLSVITGVRHDPDLRLHEIPGNVPEDGRDTKGCLFIDRCQYRTESCSGSVTPLHVSNGLVRCARAKEAV